MMTKTERLGIIDTAEKYLTQARNTAPFRDFDNLIVLTLEGVLLALRDDAREQPE